MYPKRWLQRGHPLRGRRSCGMSPCLSLLRRELGEAGTGPALCPRLQVLPLLFCLNSAAGLNAAHNVQPTAKP